MPEIQLKRVVWKTGEYSSKRAYVGKVHVGGMSWTLKRDDPNKWYATTFISHGAAGFKTEAEAKRYVEQVVLAFVRSIATVADDAPVPT